jgi:hypothetical protein
VNLAEPCVTKSPTRRCSGWAVESTSPRATTPPVATRRALPVGQSRLAWIGVGRPPTPPGQGARVGPGACYAAWDDSKAGRGTAEPGGTIE